MEWDIPTTRHLQGNLQRPPHTQMHQGAGAAEHHVDPIGSSKMGCMIGTTQYSYQLKN